MMFSLTSFQSRLPTEKLTNKSILPPSDAEHLSMNLPERSFMPSSAAERMILVFAYLSARILFFFAC
jgi:hypothetical protein